MSKPLAYIHVFGDNLVLEFDSRKTAHEIADAIYRAPPGSRFVALGRSPATIEDLHADIKAAKAQTKCAKTCVNCGSESVTDICAACGPECREIIREGPNG